MTNKQKVRGDSWERDVRETAELHAFTAHRTRAGYARDSGDVHLWAAGEASGFPDVTIQAKWTKEYDFSHWLEQLSDQLDESKAEFGFLAVKRSRPGKPPLRLAVMELDDMLCLLYHYYELSQK